ncbi:unnamed protein product [Cyprideis torosa]|uniref:Uncharacterized protein n=1 Tax=Cyprideis torosa TaxID=163714 RepID=A0A7R8WCA5_9CRUS|nr:unnamed protein product [Cyprideis torosa]CAG0890491.1 unnamed protein product [Cyprideis torosa]
MPTESDYKRMVLKEADKDGTGVTYAEIQAALGKMYGLQGTDLLEHLQKALKELLGASKIVSDTADVDAAKFDLPADDEKFEDAESESPAKKDGNLENGSHLSQATWESLPSGFCSQGFPLSSTTSKPVLRNLEPQSPRTPGTYGRSSLKSSSAGAASETLSPLLRVPQVNP